MALKRYVTLAIAARVLGVGRQWMADAWRRGHFPAPDLEVFGRKLWLLETLERHVEEAEARWRGVRERLDAIDRMELTQLGDAHE